MRALPKVELHRHLEGCVRVSTYLELAPAELKLSSAEAAKDHFCIHTRPVADLTVALDKFAHTQRLFSSVERIERLSFEAVESCALDGIVVLELRYSPRSLPVVPQAAEV